MASSRRPMVGWGIGLLVGGFAVALIALIGLARAVLPGAAAYVGTGVTAPTGIAHDLRVGDYVVYESVGSADAFGNPGPESTPTIGTRDISVTDLSGGTITVQPPTTTGTFSSGTAVFVPAGQFHVWTAGTYVVSVDQVGVTFFVAPTVSSLVSRGSPWLVVVLVAALVAVAGLILLIVGLTRRRPVTPVGPAAASVAGAGWYADPGGSGRWRWWDGRRWTDHLG